MRWKLVNSGLKGVAAIILCMAIMFFPLDNSHLSKAKASENNFKVRSPNYQFTSTYGPDENDDNRGNMQFSGEELCGYIDFDAKQILIPNQNIKLVDLPPFNSNSYQITLLLGFKYKLKDGSSIVRNWNSYSVFGRNGEPAQWVDTGTGVETTISVGYGDNWVSDANIPDYSQVECVSLYFNNMRHKIAPDSSWKNFNPSSYEMGITYTNNNPIINITSPSPNQTFASFANTK